MKNDSVLNPTFSVWRRLQQGQEKIHRFGQHLANPETGHLLRLQNGHEHCCSVGFLARYYLIKMRQYIELDEALIMNCFRIHDIPEGILLIDVAAHLKVDNDDLNEYLAFEKLMKPLGADVWAEEQRVFLLQFCLINPTCFPADARIVMSKLLKSHGLEALFFDGLQRFDYLYYAYEALIEKEVSSVLAQVAFHQIPHLDRVASKLPGFREAVWTDEKRAFFKKFY